MVGEREGWLAPGEEDKQNVNSRWMWLGWNKWERGEVKLVVGRYQQEFTERQSEGNECLSPNLCLCSQWATLFKDAILKPSTKRKTELGSGRVTKRKGTRAEEKKIDLFVISCVCLETDHYSLRGPVLLQSHSAFLCVRNSRKYSVHSQNLSLLPAHLLVCTLFFTVSITLFEPSLLRSVCQWCHFVKLFEHL